MPILCSNTRSNNSAAAVTYVLFALAVVTVATWATDGEFSAILTAAVSMQCLGLLQLAIQVHSQRSVRGLSKKSLQLFLAVLCMRVPVASLKSGYLPIDSTGDCIYQFADMLSLLLVLQLLFSMNMTYERSYMRESDTMPTKWVIPVSVVLGKCVHAHLNHSEFWDTLWFVSLYAETFALLPQLWMMSAIGGEVEGMTAHYVACMTASKGLSWIVWFHGYPELADGYVEGISEGTSNWPGMAIIFSYTSQLAMCVDFVYHYFSAALANRRMTLPQSSTMV